MIIRLRTVLTGSFYCRLKLNFITAYDNKGVEDIFESNVKDEEEALNHILKYNEEIDNG